MCVIFKKDAGHEIPYEHIFAGAIRNKHGFGVVVDTGSDLSCFNGLYDDDPEKTANEVSKILTDAKDNTAFVHLRLRTQGEVNEENLQPIPILSKDNGDSSDMYFFHNGTLDSFKDNKLSDSIIFAKRIVEPLSRRIAAYTGEDTVLKDPLFATILHEYSGWSRFALVDSFGSNLIINESKGKKQDYGWASNEYSIDPKIITEFKNPKVVYPVHWPKSNILDKSLSEKMAKNSATPQDILRTPILQRASVSTTTGYELTDFHYLTEGEIEDLPVKMPKLAALLLIDLIEFHYQMTREAA